MTDIQYSFKKKMMAWILSICLVVTLIPEFAFAVAGDNSENSKSPDEVTMTDIVEKTEDITTYDLGGGEKMSVFHGGQVRFKDDKGKLKDYDPSLETIETGETSLQDKPLQGYSYTNKAGDKKHYLPVRMSENTPVRMEYQDYAIEFSLTNESINRLSVNNKVAKKEEATIQTAYEDNAELPVNAVYGDKDSESQVTYTSTEDSVKETLILNEKSETNVFQYKLNLTGMFARKNVTDGAITYYDNETEEITGFIAAPWMNDATGDAYSEDITYELEEVEGKDGEYLLTMTIDEDYLNDPARQYPVTIDPTNTWQGSSEVKDVYVISGSTYGGTNFYESGTKKMPSGKNSTGTHRTYIKFIDLKTVTSGKSISSAKFTAYQSPDCVGSQKIGIYRITESWSISSLTYNNRPTCTTCYDTITTSSTDYAAKTWDVKTFVKNVASGSISNYGLQLYNKTSSPSFGCFVGSRASSYKPKLVVVYYDKPTVASSFTLSKSTGSALSYFPMGETIYANWSGIKSSILSQIQYKIVPYSSDDPSPTNVGTDGVDLTAYRSIGKAAASASYKYINYSKCLEEGKYKMYIRGKDSNGYVGTAKTAVFYVDGNLPVLEDVSITPSTSSDSYTDNLTPTINWNANDKYFSKVTIKIDDGTETSVTNTAGVGSYTVPEGVITSSGTHSIVVTAKDKSGKTVSETIDYHVDIEEPTGNIDPKAQATGESTDILKGTVNIAVTAEDKGSGVQTSRLDIYKTHENDESGELIIDNDSKVEIYSNYTMSHVAAFDTVDKCPENGTYRLVLYIKDKAGHETTVTKDVTVKNSFPKPKISIDHTNSSTSSLNWEFPEGTALKKLQYRFNDEEDWNDIIPEENAVSGTSQITVPVEEGTHNIYVRGISSEGVDGAVRYSQFVVDKNAPTVSLSGFDKGYLEGTAKDTNFDKWTLFVKEKSAGEYEAEPYKEGSTLVENGRITFVGFNDASFTAGTTYTFKLIAEDIAGNSAFAEMNVTAPAESDEIIKTSAELHIERNAQQERGERKFIVKSSQDELVLKEESENAKWYVDNSLTDNSLINDEKVLKYDKDTYHDVFVVSEQTDGSRKYNVPVISNVKETVSMSDGTVSENTVAKEIQTEDDVISFTIDGNIDEATYRIKAGNGEFNQIQPNQEYFVTELNEGIAYTDCFQLQITVPEGTDPTTATCDICYSYILNEEFMISEVENYAPTEFSAVDKVNYKTYLSWIIPETLPDNISYEVYRGEESGFKPSTETLAASGIKDGYFAEINILYSSEFYYRVCAVETDAYGNVINRSSFSTEAGSAVIDEEEYAKNLGMKEYWEFTEFETANGNGYIEKSQGNFVYVQRDAQIPNEGLEVYLDRTYNSQSSSQGAFGYGWSHDYDMELLNVCESDSLEFNNVVFKDGDGTIFYFSRNDKTEEFKSSLGSYINLEAKEKDEIKSVKISGDGNEEDIKISYRFLMSTKDGLQYYFNSGGQLVYMEEANGNFLIFEHASNKGLLTRMITNNNLSIDFTYYEESEGDPLLVKQVEMPDETTVSYEYDKPLLASHDLLTKVTAKAGSESIEYEYSYSGLIFESAEKNLTEIKDAKKANTYTIDYDGDKVSEVKYLNDEKITFVYSDDQTYTVTKKYSDGKAVLGEKDYFEESSGRCIMSVRGVEDPDALDTSTQAEEEAAYDVTKYNYTNGLLYSTVTTEEYNLIDDSGFISTAKDTKTETVKYDGDDPIKETESNGTVSEYTYYPEDDTNGRADLIKTSKETDAEGNIISNVHYDYDGYGNVTSEIDYAAGTKEIMTYHADGDFKGELWTEKEYLIAVDGTTIVNEYLQSTTVYTYTYSQDDNGKTIKIETVEQTIPIGENSEETVTVTTVYDEMGREISETDSRGYVTSNTYDGFGRKTSTDYRYDGASSAAKTTETSYDANGLVTYEKLEDGIKKWYTYDNMQRVTEIEINKGDVESTAQTVTTTYSYEDIEVYCGKGNETVSVKNAYKTESNCDGSIISATYEDNLGRIVRTYENGLYTDMTYNMQGDMITKWSMGKTLSATEGLLEVYVYDKQGNLTHTVTDPDYISGTGYQIRPDSQTEDGEETAGSIVSENKYDDAGNVIATIDPMGARVDYTYDETGNLLSATVPYKSLDASEDIVTYQYKYDVAGSNNTTQDIVLEPHVDAEGNVVTAKSIVVKDSADRTIKVADLGLSDTDDTSIYTEYTYNIRDNLTEAKEKNGNKKVYSYDTRDRVTSIEYYEGTTNTLKTVFTYDDADNMTSMADYKYVDGTANLYRYTAYEYDMFSRLTAVAECDTETIPTDVSNYQIRYTYDAKDNLTKIEYPNDDMGVSSLEFEYDANNWLAKVTANGNKTVREYTYDNFGRTSVITDYTDFLNDSSKWMKRTYSYDKFHRPVSIEYTDNMIGSESDVKEGHYYTYDNASNITSERTVNVYGQGNAATYEELREYTYNDAGQLINTDITKKNSSGESIEQKVYSYDYDVSGNRTKETVTTLAAGINEVEDTSYTYTEFNQLDTAVTVDETGATTSSKTFTYDGNGNQIKEVDIASDTTIESTFSYDADNRLETASEKNGNVVEYTQNNEYNGFGQRVRKSESISGVTDTTNYFYDGTSVLYTTDGEGSKTSFNLIGAEDNILSTARADEGSVDFYVYTKDLRESTINMVGSDGISPVTYNYTDYGETEVLGDQDFYNEVCYSAGIYDDTTGLYYLNARYYSPENGAFLTQDTYRGDRSRTYTLNYYAYCAGNPIAYTDPSGHAIWGVVGAAMGAYDGYKYAKKKNLKGWKKAAAIVGGAALGAVNPFKVVKAAKKVVKAAKYTKKALSSSKKLKAVGKALKKTKTTKVKKIKYKGKTVTVKTKKLKKTTYKKKKTATGKCFVAGTKISTEKGFTPIEQIKPGDYVWSEDHATNEKALKKVKKIFVREKDSIIRLSINGEVIETTQEHPFYVEGIGFIAAGELKASDEVRLQSGEAGLVDYIEEVALDEPIKVYNFEVEDFHTYYVSEQKVLVHNTCAKETAKNTASNYRSKAKEVAGKKVYQRDDLIDPDLVDGRGRTNLQRMEKGLAPIGPDGKSINLHHMTQTDDSAIAEVSASFHQRFSKIIHINPSSMASGIDRKNFNKWRKQYWKERVKSYQ